jgi:hypothetical protein
MLAAVIQDRAAPVETPVRITLERTSCFGSCPVYSVSIDGDGTVTYEGRQFVRVAGRQTSQISRAAVDALLEEFRRIDFFSLQDQYTAPVTDHPTTYVTFRHGKRTKRIRDYVGAPKALRDLERHIDEAAGVQRWIRIDAGTVKDLVRGGWRAGGQDGQQLLQDALQYDETDVVEALIDGGADVNAPFYGTGPTPLMTARSATAARFLIEAGADVNTSTRGYPAG